MTNDQLKQLVADTLTERQRSVYLLKYQRGLGLKAIALHLDVSVSTVRSTLAEADRKMDRALGAQAAA